MPSSFQDVLRCPSQGENGFDLLHSLLSWEKCVWLKSKLGVFGSIGSETLGGACRHCMVLENSAVAFLADSLAESPRLHCAYDMQAFSVNILAQWYYFNFNFEQGTAQGKRLDLNRSSFLQACCQQEEKLVFIHAHLASQVCDLA